MFVPSRNNDNPISTIRKDKSITMSIVPAFAKTIRNKPNVSTGKPLSSGLIADRLKVSFFLHKRYPDRRGIRNP
jgi:hypothetical protein